MKPTVKTPSEMMEREEAEKNNLPMARLLPGQGHIVIAMANMQAELAKIGIAKNKEGEHKTKVRGIDDIRNTISVLQPVVGLLILPHVTKRTAQEFSTKTGTRAVHVVLDMDFHFISTVDGSSIIVPGQGEAIDYADKACGKAMSYAYKNMCINAFNIPTEGEEDIDTEKNIDLRAGAVSAPAQSGVKAAYEIQPIIRPDGTIDHDEFAAELENKIPMMQSIEAVSLLNRANAKTLRDMEKNRPDLFKHIGILFNQKSQSLM